MKRTVLARLPTPLQRLDRLSAREGADLWVKRDDLTGLGLSGNKVRKLEFLLAEALERGVTTVFTTGGIQSNHCRATAVACRQLGLRPVLLLRGEPPAVPDSNLLLDQLLGAEVHWCTPEDYRERRNEMLAELAAAAEARGEVSCVIPEGGSSAVGSLGYQRAAEELATQIDTPFDSIVVAVGSGGTLAGLALGPQLGPLRGMAVCDDAAYFEQIVQRLHREAAAAGFGAAHDRWSVDDGFVGEAYGVAGPEVWQVIADVAQTEGLFLDPVYTGKAFTGLLSRLRAGELGERVLFWHTGGAFGLFGRGHELPG